MPGSASRAATLAELRFSRPPGPGSEDGPGRRPVVVAESGAAMGDEATGSAWACRYAGARPGAEDGTPEKLKCSARVPSSPGPTPDTPSSPGKPPNGPWASR